MNQVCVLFFFVDGRKFFNFVPIEVLMCIYKLNMWRVIHCVVMSLHKNHNKGTEQQ